MWLCSGGRAHSAAEALALLGGGSLRLFQDLRLCVQNGWQPWVFLREWREMAEHAEWRGFLRDGELVGLSQYHVAAVQCNADVQALRNGGAQALVVLGARVQAALGQHDMVFDAWLRPDGRAELIELNPSGPCTDTALFDRTAPTLDGTLRWRGLQCLMSLPLALVQSAATAL